MPAQLPPEEFIVSMDDDADAADAAWFLAKSEKAEYIKDISWI